MFRGDGARARTVLGIIGFAATAALMSQNLQFPPEV
jgi:hypothetical protein